MTPFEQAEEILNLINNSNQSEIDTINNSVKIYNEVIDDQKREIEELTKEVERLKSEALFNATTILPAKDSEIDELRAEVERLKKEVNEYNKLTDKVIALYETNVADLTDIGETTLNHFGLLI